MEFGPDGLPSSSKGEEHGLGLQSVRSVADKYGGLLRCQWDNGNFILRAVLISPAAQHVSPKKPPLGLIPIAILCVLASLILLNVMPAPLHLGKALQPSVQGAHVLPGSLKIFQLQHPVQGSQMVAAIGLIYYLLVMFTAVPVDAPLPDAAGLAVTGLVMGIWTAEETAESWESCR
mgnify:CR=1 FL=1